MRSYVNTIIPIPLIPHRPYRRILMNDELVSLRQAASLQPEIDQSSQSAELKITDESAQNDSFPLDALPSPLRQFTVECAASLPVAPEMVGIPALVVTGAAIGNTRAIRLKDGWTESTALWAALVSPSGTMKSPALKQVAEPLLKLD